MQEWCRRRPARAGSSSGFGTSKIFLNNIRSQTSKTLGPMRDAVTIVRGVLGGEPFEYEGDTWSASVPGLSPDAHTPREVPPVYVAATAPKMQALAGEISDGCLTPSITTPAFVRYTRENVAADIDIGCTVVASIHESDREAGRDGAREIAGMYLANKFQNIRGSADTLLQLAGIEMEELAPVAEAMERGGRLAAKAEVTDSLLDRCKPIAGTPEDCIAAIEEYRAAGCTHVMLELWGDRRHDQIRLFGETRPPTLPVVTDYDAAAFDAYEQAGWEAIAGRFSELLEPDHEPGDRRPARCGARRARARASSTWAPVPATQRDPPSNVVRRRRASTSRRRWSRSLPGGTRTATLRPGSGDRASVRRRLLRRGRRQQRHPAHRRAGPEPPAS